MRGRRPISKRAWIGLGLGVALVALVGVWLTGGFNSLLYPTFSVGDCLRDNKDKVLCGEQARKYRQQETRRIKGLVSEFERTNQEIEDALCKQDPECKRRVREVDQFVEKARKDAIKDAIAQTPECKKDQECRQLLEEQSKRDVKKLREAKLRELIQELEP